MAIAYPGQTFTVTQSGLGACTYSVSPPLLRIHRATGTGRVTVSAAPGCPWSAESHAPWITIASGASGTGNGVVTYRLASNAGRGRSRNGTMTIARQDLTVTQAR